MNKGEWKEVASELLMRSLKIAVKAIGKEKLDINDDTVGTHYIRTSHAMFLYINKFNTPKIILLGRWKSDCFMKYIQNQVKEFSKEVRAHIIGE